MDSSAIECVFVAGGKDLLGRFETARPCPASAFESIMQINFFPGLLCCVPDVGPKILSPQVAEFVFPNGFYLHARKRAPAIFSFVITAGDGSRRYVSCLVFSELLDIDIVSALHARLAQERNDQTFDEALLFDSKVYASKAVCLLHSLPIFTFARSLLAVIYNQCIDSVAPTFTPERLVAYILKVPRPMPGGPLYQLNIGASSITTPAIRDDAFLPLADIPFSVLFRRIGLNLALLIFRTLLVGEKLLFVSKSPTLLNMACCSFATLLFPLKWRNVFIPILPPHLMDYIDNPTPYVMGITAETFAKLRNKPDVVIVNLDTCTYNLSINIPDLPEFEREMLTRDINNLLELDSSAYDNVGWNPWESRNIDDVHSFNEIVQLAFLKCLISLIRDHRTYTMYQRVLPEPSVFFDSESFLASDTVLKDPSVMDFYRDFVSTQTFTCFIKERPWPVGDFIDRCIDEQIWEVDCDQLVGNYIWDIFAAAPEKERETISLTVPPGGQSIFSLGTFDIAEADILKEPCDGIKDVESAPCPYEQHPPLLLPEISEIPSFSFRPNTMSEQFLVQCDSFLRNLTMFPGKKVKGANVERVRLPSASKSPRVDQISPEEEEYNDFLQSLENRNCRLQFCHFMVMKASQEKRICKLNIKTWLALGEFLIGLINADPNDYALAWLCIEIAERFFVTMNNEDFFVISHIKPEKVWGEVDFWRFLFASRLHDCMRKIYNQDLIESWVDLSDQEKDDLISAEWGFFKTQISTLGTKMATLGQRSELLKAFGMDVCSTSCLPRDKEQQVMSILESMPCELEAQELSTVMTLPMDVTDAQLVVFWVANRGAITPPSSVRSGVEKQVPQTAFVEIASLDMLKNLLPQYMRLKDHENVRIVVPHLKSDSAISLSDVCKFVRMDLRMLTVPIFEYIAHKLADESEINEWAGSKVYTGTSVDCVVQFCVMGKTSTPNIPSSGSPGLGASSGGSRFSLFRHSAKLQ